MPSPMVVELKISFKSLTGLPFRLISLQIHLLVLYTSPEPLDKNIIHPPAPAIHTNTNTLRDEYLCKYL